MSPEDAVEGGGVSEEEEVKEAERLSAAPLGASDSPREDAAHDESSAVEESVALSIPLFPSSSFSPTSSTPFLPSADRPLSLIQLQWTLRAPTSQKQHKGLLPLTHLPSLIPRAYHLRTSSAVSLTPNTSLSFTPTLLASPSSLYSSLRVALTSTLSPSLTSSLAFNLSTPSSLTLTTQHSSPSHSTLLHLTADTNSLRIGARWRRRLGPGHLVVEAEDLALGSVAWEWGGWGEEREVRQGRVGVRWLKGVVECASRLSLPLSHCPPFNRLYVHSALVLPASTLVPSAPSPPLTSPEYVDLRLQPDRFALAHTRPMASSSASSRASLTPSPSWTSTARLSVELGVTANINRQHKVDIGLGWSTSGLYVHLAFSSPSTTWSFPVYIAPPSLMASSPLLSPFALCIGVPVSSVFVYTFLVAPLHRIYQRKAAPPSSAAASDAQVYRHVMQPLAAMRRLASPSLVLASARYGWAVAASTRCIRPSHPLFRWGGGEGGAAGVEWVEVREVDDVIAFWIRDGRMAVGEGRKSRMLGMEAIQRPKRQAAQPLVLGLYLRYTSDGVERHVFVGEREGIAVPDPHHKSYRSG